MAQSSDPDASGVVDEHEAPAIAAAFLVTFDNRKGYTISWQRSQDSIELDGIVEFKALPSGLHNIDEDLIYFVVDDFAGISAFLRQDDEAAARNTRMLSVGALVPFDTGRMGKSFLYAQELKELASTLISNLDDLTPLENFWQQHKQDEEQSQGPQKDSQELEGYQKLRALSTSSLNISNANRTLPSHHPALALPELLQSFGPLIFPLIRAALLQKRILILGEAPVELTCNFVYGMSILSSISRAVGAHIPGFDTSRSRLRPLFNIGISDVTRLEALEGSWIACTTDDVLASKPKLFDLLVILPGVASVQPSGPRSYPKLIHSTPELSKQFPKHGLRATQRDGRRYSSLTNSLKSLPSGAVSEVPSLLDGTGDAASTTSSVTSVIDHREAVEPMPWSLIAYTSLIWWVSAGDSRSGLIEAEELAQEQDEEILRESIAEEGTTKEVAIVAYFHKLSNLVFSVLNNAVRRSGVDEQDRYRDGDDHTAGDDEDRALLASKDDGTDKVVEVTEEDVRAMGLDIWSESDKKFISDMVWLWWERKAVVQAGSIECCGIRIA